MTRLHKIKYQIARRYTVRRSVSIVQAGLKTSLIPLKILDECLPREGTILDLGCGEGILANAVAAMRPGCDIIGIDRGVNNVDRAVLNKERNARFIQGDIFQLGDGYRDVAAVILNDVVHHQHYRAHQPLIFDVLNRLRLGGVLVLKEVDQCDRADAGMTRFFDSRLYPDDPLCFRGKNEWRDLMARLGADDVVVHRVRHPWPASRTVFVVRRPQQLLDPWTAAAKVGEENERLSGSETNVLITGATGFLGGHLCRNLLAHELDGKPVRLVYLARNPHRQLNESGTAIPIFGDLDDLPGLKAGLRGIDYVFHLAAEVKLTKGVDIWRNNHLGTLAVVEALKGTPVKRLIHASSIGAVDRDPSDDCRQPLTEDIEPHPLSEYGRTKLEGERIVQESGIPHAILRITWAYGPGMTPDTHVRFLTDGVARAKLFSRVAFPGRVSVLSATDAAAAFRLLATHRSAVNQVFYASDGRPISLRDLFRRYASVIGRRHTMLPFPSPIVWLIRRLRRFLPLQVRALASDVLTADPKKLSALGFRPSVELREGLAELARDQGYLPALAFGEPRRPVSIVTGAAGGIGSALARRMSDEGHSLLLVDTNADGLKLVADQLNARRLELDLSDPEATGNLEQYLSANALHIDWLVNNAGIGARGEMTQIDLPRLRRLVNVNCVAVMALSQQFVLHAQRSGYGTLVNIGSSAGFQPLPFMAVYAASKSFVQSMTMALVGEMAGKRAIGIILVDPSGTDTGFQSSAGVTKNPSERLLSADAVASAIVEAAYHCRRTVIVGRRGQAMAILARLLPRTSQIRLWAQLMSRLR